MGCVIFQCYPYGLTNANAENFNGGRTSSRVRHGFNCQQLQHLPTFIVANSCNMLHRCPYHLMKNSPFNTVAGENLAKPNKQTHT